MGNSMKLIFEEDKDDDQFKGQDYLEIILNEKEYGQLGNKPIVKTFPLGLFDARPLNASIRVDKLTQ